VSNEKETPKKEKAAPETIIKVDPDEVSKIIRKSVYAAMGIGIVPIPFFNLAAVSTSSIIMIKKLSELYGIEFKEGVARKIITAVIGAGVGTLASEPVASVLSAVPLIGLPLAVATKPAINGMTTYALGRMFVTHFEEGGGFVSVNIEAMKDSFSSAFKNSRDWLGETIKGKEKEAAAEA